MQTFVNTRPLPLVHRLALRAGGVAALVVALAGVAGVARAATLSDSLASPPLPPARVRAWQVGLLRTDRLQHASLSFTLAAGGGSAGATRAQALAFTLALGVLKELRDSRRDRFDPLDLAADAYGAALGSFAGAAR